MPQYRKKPVVIEAMQINVSTEHKVIAWSEGKVYASPVLEPDDDNPSGEYWQIKTLEGIMTANPGDFIIKGIKGEYYPCKPDIFEATYDALETPTVQNYEK